MSNMIQPAIRLMAMVMFLGYMMIWVMMPTNTFWLHWLPRIHSASNSTFLGQQGGNILVYTAPVLLIATLACIYLHLQNKLSHHPNNQRWEVKLDSMALMLGLVGNICLAFLFFPVTRGSPLLRLIGLTSESSIKYHIWVGHITMVLFTAHGICYTVFWAKTHQISQILKWEKIGISNVAGEVGLLTGLGIWLTSIPRIRRNIFELFYYTHHLYILFVAFFILHVGFSYCWITLPGFYLFLVDRMLRFLKS